MAAKAPTSNSKAESVAHLLSHVSAEGNDFLSNNSEEARQKLISSARDLVVAAESPVESLFWNIWALPTQTVAARVAVDLKIFETALTDNGRSKTNDDFASAVGADPALVKRITRALVSMKMLDEEGPDSYVPNELTKLLAMPEYVGGITFSFDITRQSFAQLPSYLRKTNFKNPEDALDGPFQYANKCESVFTYLAEHPEVFKAFHASVHAMRAHRPSWTDMYPVRERLVDGLKTEGDASSTFADLGGGTGQILQAFQAAVPEYTGRLVLQEAPQVIEAAKSMGVGGDGRIELQVHDFFTPQPIKGARAYFMRSVLHDWPDDHCRKILGHIKDVMEPGYSRILISDCVVADTQAAWQHVAFDLLMMAQVSAKERTKSEWYALIESCGLQIAGIYNKGEGNEGLIEVVLP